MSARGRFFFPPTVVRSFASDLAARTRNGPAALDYETCLSWLCEASDHATRRPTSEDGRDDQREVWRAGRAYGGVRFVLEPASPAGELPVCVAVRR